MFNYHVFGGVLATPFEFPELDPGQGKPDWVLRRMGAQPTEPLGTVIGEDTVYGQVKVRCHRGPTSHQLDYDDTGRFDVATGDRLDWYPPAELGAGALDAARADIVGRVIALALHQRGILSLHASAVSIAGTGVALLAPKGHGKSTLAAALVGTGARLLSDDTVPVLPGPPARLRPGVPQIRLWKDSAARLVAEAASDASASRKLVLDHLDPSKLEACEVPFAGAYILEPAPRTSSVAVAREAMGEIQSTLALIEHAKIGPLLGGIDAAAMFDQAAAIARAVPVWTLRVARDLDRVTDVAAQVVAWHA